MRRVRIGEKYTIDEEREEGVSLVQVASYPEPPEEIQGEPWGWTKGAPRPLGWRKDGKYGPE